MTPDRTMYPLKPIISLPHVLNETLVMYKMKNIHAEEGKGNHAEEVNEIKTVPDVTNQVINFLKSPLPEYAALETRQEKILSQLAELKMQVSNLCDYLKQTNQTEPVKAAVQKAEQQPLNIDIAVNANPKRPPYSLLALKKVWTDVNIGIQSFVHSSITEMPVLGTSFNTGSRGCDINFSLIWKDVNWFEFVINSKSFPLMGEVNLLRYVSRLVDAHNYEKSTCLTQTTVTDAILDQCHALLFQENPKDILETLKVLASMFNEHVKPLADREVSIADIALWSTIKQLNLKKLPGHMNKWFATCDDMFK